MSVVIKDMMMPDKCMGCIHTDYEGFACLALAFEGGVAHMVGHNPETGMCEMYLPMGEEAV